jgi:hypothetical protein
MPRKAKRPQILQVVGGSQPNFLPALPALPALPNMSQPTAAATAQAAANAAAAGAPDAISATLMAMSGNPYIIGIFYMFLNLGGRFLSLELTKRQEWFLSQSYVRPFILFAVLFIATRNLAVALYTSIFILSVLWLFANENSVLCLIPSWRANKPDHVNNDKAYNETMAKLQKKKESHDDHHDGHHDEHPTHDETAATAQDDHHDDTAAPAQDANGHK